MRVWRVLLLGQDGTIALHLQKLFHGFRLSSQKDSSIYLQDLYCRTTSLPQVPDWTDTTGRGPRDSPDNPRLPSFSNLDSFLTGPFPAVSHDLLGRLLVWILPFV